MALTNVRKRFCSLSREVIHTGRVRQMANYTQHGTTTTLDHTVAVAFRALTLARGLNRIGEDENLHGGQKLTPIDLPVIPESIAPTRIKFAIGMGFNNSWQ